MIFRDTCPLCAGQVERCFSWPFNSEILLPRILNLAADHCVQSLLLENYEVYYCKPCEFAFQRIAPESHEIVELYSLHQDESAILAEIAAQKLHWFAHMTEEILVARQLLPAGRLRVLDFGCNWGKWASMALAFGCEVDAVEVNPVAAKFCQSRGIRIVNPDDLEPSSYQFINVDQVLEHLTNPLEVTKKLVKCLAPKGIMKWSTPREKYLVRNLRVAQETSDDSILSPEHIDALAPLLHINLFSNHSLRVLGANVGLKPVSLPFFKWLGAGQLWNIPRQLGRNLTVPYKRWSRQGTYLWFQR